MKFRKLEPYISIFEDNSFAFIGAPENIEKAENMIAGISYSVNPAGERGFLLSYLQALKGFFSGFDYKGIPELAYGEELCHDAIARAAHLLKDEKRTAISGKYCRKWAKQFKAGIKHIAHGLLQAFDSDSVYKIGIRPRVVMNFILDKKVGLGTRYAFNRVGKHAFCIKIDKLDDGELLAVLRLLQKHTATQIRKIKGWIDLGKDASPVRILTVHSILGRDKVYFLFKTNPDHNAYQDIVTNHKAETYQFEEAA